MRRRSSLPNASVLVRAKLVREADPVSFLISSHTADARPLPCTPGHSWCLSLKPVPSVPSTAAGTKPCSEVEGLNYGDLQGESVAGSSQHGWNLLMQPLELFFSEKRNKTNEIKQHCEWACSSLNFIGPQS